MRSNISQPYGPPTHTPTYAYPPAHSLVPLPLCIATCPSPSTTLQTYTPYCPYLLLPPYNSFLTYSYPTIHIPTYPTHHTRILIYPFLVHITLPVPSSLLTHPYILLTLQIHSYGPHPTYIPTCLDTHIQLNILLYAHTHIHSPKYSSTLAPLSLHIIPSLSSPIMNTCRTVYVIHF